MAEAWKRTVEINLRFYGALTKLTGEYLRAVIGTIAALTSPPKAGLQAATGIRGGSTETDEKSGREAAPTTEGSGPVLELEAEAGGQAMAAFMIENKLADSVSTPVALTDFEDDSGRVEDIRISLNPDVIVLEPGEQTLVRVIASIHDRMKPGASYRAELRVPELSSGSVHVVARRRQSSDVPSVLSQNGGSAD